MVADRDAAEGPIEPGRLASPARALAVQAELSPESGILRGRAIVRPPCDDPRVLGGRERAARQPDVGVAP